MRLSFIALALIVLAAMVGVAPMIAQDEDDVRGAFLTSRAKEKPPQNTAQPNRPSRRRPKPSPTPEKRQNSGSVTPTPQPVDSTQNRPVKVNNPRLGLGMTLFMRDSNGLAVRTDPSHVFHKGDRVRVLLETNTDGYLYIFNTTDDGPPVMIYPQIELDDAGNYLQAHVPFEIPSSLASEERLRWLVFDENAGNEHLFFVFTTEPLSGVPIEDDLIALCHKPNVQCPLKPPVELWTRVQSQLKIPVQTDRATKYGAAQTSSEHQATTRGLGLATSDPEPSVIMMATSNTSILVTSLDLVHR